MNRLLAVIILLLPVYSYAQPKHEQLVYGHKDGMALVMEKVTPSKPNGKAILYMMSGGYHSYYTWLPRGLQSAEPFLKHGYTVFLVFHGSQPHYNMLDIVKDVTRAVKFVRYNAKNFSVDADHIGITGNSSGGHLSLYAATADESMIPDSKDPVERVSSKIQAVCVFYPPTDFLNYGENNDNVITDMKVASERKVTAAFDFKTWNDSTQQYEAADKNKTAEIVKQLSPFHLASKDDAPAYIVHGDKDWVVPLQQSQILVERYKSLGVPAELVVKKGLEHGWKDENADREKMAVWFNNYLK